jgi:hypothetical protein
MKIGDLVYPRYAPKQKGGQPLRVGLVMGKSFGSYNGTLMQIKWSDKGIPMWEPKRYLVLYSENR